MTQKKKFHPAPRLTNEEIDKELTKIKFKDKNKQNIFDVIKETSWFRSYARNSKAALKKITLKVKKGIQHSQYGSGPVIEKIRGYTEKRKQKKMGKRIQKEEKLQQKIVKLTRKEREIKYAEETGYTKYEIHEGKNSKRSIEYRKRNNITNRGKENGY